MKFGKNLIDSAIPQWKQCYIDYQHLKMFVSILKKIIVLLHSIKQNQTSEPDQEATMQNLLQDNQLPINKAQKLEKYEKQLLVLANEANQLFYEAHRNELRINNHFVHMKMMELKGKYKSYSEISQHVSQKDDHDRVKTLIEFLYIEATFLKRMKDDNIEAERKILKKHQKYVSGFVPTPKPAHKYSNRLLRELKKQTDMLQDYYVQLSDGPSKKNRAYLRQISEKVEVRHSQSFFFGTYIGICLTIIIVLIIILTLNQKSIETDPIFNRDFPTWRGIAYFIFYMWIIGANTYFFEQFNISHRIIFHYNEHHYSPSTVIFILSGVFSALFLIMFTVYTLTITGILNPALQSHYFVAFVWLIFIAFWFNPIPILLWKTRLYALKLIFISAISPIIGVPFEVVWMTDQLVSLVTPFKDFAYTICYYQNIDFKSDLSVQDNYCSSSTRIEVVFVVGAIAYSYRAIQCIRQGISKRKYFLTPQFFNTIKYLSSLMTLVLSYEYKAQEPKLFAAWLALAAFSTIYSFIWDLKMDWMLLEWDAPRKLLRTKLTYHPYQIYYLIIFLNLIFRLAWLATLSPSIVENTFGSPQIFSLVTGAIEIVRRGIWNLLRVEKQHLVNCQNFQAMPQTAENINEKLMESFRDKKVVPESSNFDLAEIQQQNLENKKIAESFMTLVREEISKEEETQRQRIELVKDMKKKIKRIENKVEKIIGRPLVSEKEKDDDDD